MKYSLLFLLLVPVLVSAASVNGCLDERTGLPEGEYLEQLTQYCRKGITESECFKELVSYDSEKDRLSLVQHSARYTLGKEVLGFLPIVLPGACKLKEQGFDIVLPDEGMASGEVPFHTSRIASFAALLLKPIEKSENPYRRERYLPYVQSYCDKGLSWPEEGSLGSTLTCHTSQHSDEMDSIQLEHAYNCSSLGLDVVQVKDQLYCLDVATTVGVAAAQVAARKRTGPSGDYQKQGMAEWLMKSNFPARDLAKIIRVFDQEMYQTPFYSYIEDWSQMGHQMSNGKTTSMSYITLAVLLYPFSWEVTSELFEAGVPSSPAYKLRDVAFWGGTLIANALVLVPALWTAYDHARQGKLLY
ncbi:hypothetical protein EOPP23_07015 [Endozoicomonas sp. OPT23]|uniref:hypothetical protein n=1 Tax=Endozoicomonas sp. OPT23 TaxID=2072845 RepID=UPI00129A756C|nr:hypothetical protein [Endozoicomonas sp. OPT23]MRI32736.1 hypothetical protein [Endozoicomonas sp. OPT23]